MQDLDGTFVITGSNTGVGRATAEELGRRGAHVWLACRSKEKAEPVAESIVKSGGRASFLRLDLSDLASVRAAARTLLDDPTPIDALINNAGVAARGRTKDGFELNFGTNHLGHFLFTLLLMPKLRARTSARIVHVASNAHYPVKRIDFDALRAETRSRTGFPEYQVSKLANLLFSRQLAKKLEGSSIRTYAVHPGVVASDLWRNLPAPLRLAASLFLISNEKGARTSVYCATSSDVANDSGLYYEKCKARKPSALAVDDALAAELWRRSVEWTGAPEI